MKVPHLSVEEVKQASQGLLLFKLRQMTLLCSGSTPVLVVMAEKRCVV